MPRKWRRKQTAPDDAVNDGDNILSDDEHAWWASRPRLQHSFGYTGETEAAPEPEPSRVGEPWTYASVFESQADEPGTPAAEAPPSAGPDARNLAEVFVEEAAYRVLDLAPGATWEEVVASHRRLAKRYHPDRLIDADPVTRLDGEQKMREANAAYEKLRQQTRVQTSGLFGP